MDVSDEHAPLLPDNRASARLKWRFVPVEVPISLFLVSVMISTNVSRFYTVGQLKEEASQNDTSANGHQTLFTTAYRHMGLGDNLLSDQHVGASMNTCEKDIHENGVQQRASTVYLYLALSSLPCIIPTLFFGSITDKIGRKPFLVVCIVGSFVKHLLTLAVVHWNLSFQFLYLGGVIEAVSGGFPAVSMTAFGIISDVSQAGAKRGFRLSLIEAIVAFCSALTTLGLGFWFKHSNYENPMIAAVVITFCNLLFVLVFIPETAKQRDRTTNFASLKILTRCFRFYVKGNEKVGKGIFILCLLIYLLTACAIQGKGGITYLYLLKSPLCWDSQHILIFVAVEDIVTWVSSVVVVKVFQKIVLEQGLMIVGSISGIAGYLFLAFGQVDWMIYTYAALSMLVTIIMPMVRSLMSQIISPKEQGGMFAGLGSLQVLLVTGVGVGMNRIYSHTIKTFAGTSFLVTIGLTLIVLFLSIVLYLVLRNDSQLGTRTTEGHGTNSEQGSA